MVEQNPVGVQIGTMGDTVRPRAAWRAVFGGPQLSCRYAGLGQLHDRGLADHQRLGLRPDLFAHAHAT